MTLWDALNDENAGVGRRGAPPLHVAAKSISRSGARFGKRGYGGAME